MDTAQVTLFFEQTTTWPNSVAELDGVADRILKILDFPWVVVFSNRTVGPQAGFLPLDSREHEAGNSSVLSNLKMGFHSKDLDQISGPGEQYLGRMGSADRQTLGETLKKHLKFPLKNYTGIQVTENLRTSFFSNWPYLSSTRYLLWIHLVSNFAQGPGQGRIYFGTLVLGSVDPPTEDKEATLIMLARHLVDLGQMATLETDIQIRNQFLSIASHELKTPLTSIYGILQLQERMLRLKKDQQLAFPDQERHHHFLKMVIRQVERLNDLIDGLLDVSRIQSGRFNVDLSDTDVAVLLRESVQNRLTMIASEAGVKIQIDSVPKLMAKVDPVRIEEVVSNLVMNAIRFSPEGGVVRIRLREDGDAFRLTVRDQGPSIPLEDRERIFQPFERVQRTSRMGGLGLGLFISRQIALLHGGNVSLVESVPGKGNVIEAYFPIHENSKPEEG